MCKNNFPYRFSHSWVLFFSVRPASLVKHLEAYEVGALSGDMEYATSNLYQYSTSAVFGCGEDLNMLGTSIRSYIRRCLQCKHVLVAKCLVV